MNRRIQVAPAAYIYLALLLLVLPLRWVAAILLSAVVHELGHLIAIRLLGVPVRYICIGITGTTIATGPLLLGEEMLSALAGPISGIIVAFLLASFPEFALCSLMHAVYNLIPVYPSDGGRALRGILLAVFPEKVALGLCRGVTAAFLLLMCLYLIRLQLAGFAVAVCAITVGKSLGNKNSLQRWQRQCTIEPFQH